MAACFGDDPDLNLEILIGQLVNLVQDGEPVRMSKRAGTVVTLEDLVDAIGVDAARYALARYSGRLADRHRHRRCGPGPPATTRSTTCSTSAARTASVARNAAERRPAPRRAGRRSDPSCSATTKENDLLKALGEFPAVVATAAELREPHRVARYLEELAGAYHRFYDKLPGAAAGRRADHRPAPGPAVAQRRDPDGDRQRAGPARRLRARNGCRHACAHMRPARCTATSGTAGPPGCVRPTTSTPWCRSCGRGP